MIRRKKFQFDWGKISPLVLIGGALAIAIVGLYCFRLTHLVPVAPGEQTTIQTLSQPANLLDNPLLLPYKLLATILLQLPGDPTRMVRLAAVVLSLTAIGLFYILARRWYGQLNGLAATVLFAASGWLLHSGRYGAGYVTLTLMVIGLLNLAVWVNSTENSNRAVLIFAAGSSLALFVPGGLWFILVATFICRESLAEHLKETGGRYLAASAAFFAITGAILGLAFARDVSLLQQWLGMPIDMPSVITAAKQATLSISGFTIRGPVLPEIWLAHTPLLDVAASTLIVLGLLFYRRHLRNPRTYLLGLFLIISCVLTALNGAAALSYGLPLMYLILGGGFAYLLHQWKKVFPRNPIAEAVALSLLGFLMICMITFHTQRFFIAWRYSPTTTEARQLPEPASRPLPYLVQ